MFEFKGDVWEYRKRSGHRNELKIGSEVGAGLVQRWVAEFPPLSLPYSIVKPFKPL